jgi:hypothetical protein
MTFSEMRKFQEAFDNKELNTPFLDYEQPNPEDYPNTPQGDQEFIDDYWQGDIDAMLYHDDMGNR